MKYNSMTSSAVQPLKESHQSIQKMAQSTLIKWDNTNLQRKSSKNANQSMELHETYGNYYAKLDLSNQKDKLFKQNVELKRQVHKLEDQIIDSRFKANLWETIKQNIMRHPISQGMITKKHGGCDSSFLKEFLQIIFEQPENSKKPASLLGFSTVSTEYTMHRVSSTKTLNIQPKNASFEKLQQELQQKSRKLITLEYQLNLLKQHNVFLQSNGKLDKNLRLDKIKRMVEEKSQKLKVLEERQLKLQQIIGILKRQYQNVLFKCQKNQEKVKAIEAEKQKLMIQLKQENTMRLQAQQANLYRKIQSLTSSPGNKNERSNAQWQMDQQQIKRLKDRNNQLSKQVNKLVRTMNKFRMNLCSTRNLNLSNLQRLSEDLDGQMGCTEDMSSSRGSQRFFYTPKH